MSTVRPAGGGVNADKLDGSDWAAPPAIGATTPAAGSFTTLTATSNGAGLTVGSGADADSWVNLAGGRAFVGYDTPNGALLQGDSSGPAQLRGGHATFGSGALGVHVEATTGNVGLGGAASFGTSAVGVAALNNGTAPTTAPADKVQLYSKDFAAGDARMHFMNEQNAGVVILPAEGEISEVAWVSGAINLKVVAVTTLITVPTGHTLVVNRVVIKENAANANLGTVTFSLGGNAAAYDDWLGSTDILVTELASGASPAYNIMTYQPTLDTDKKSYAAAAAFSINVTVASTGTTRNVKVLVFGYLL